jgi:hypothetical protein
MGGNWGFEGRCRGNSIKTCQYSLSRFDGLCGSFFVPPLVSISPTWMLFRMLIGDLSSTWNDDDYSMHNNLLSIVWTGDNFNDARRKKIVELKAVEVLVPHFNHVDSNVIAYASPALIRYNHNKIVQCCIKISKNQGKVIWTIWQVILVFVMFSKLKDMLVPFLVDVPFTALPLKSRVRKISSSPMVFLYWFQCSTFLIQSSHSWLWW